MAVTAVSLFSGCGGFDLGARRAGVQILWANDINRYAAATYRKYFPGVDFVQGNIRRINKKRIPEADLLFGCYPCQGFSSGAWRRWGDRPARDLHENRKNYLYLQFIEVIPYVKPKFVFIENVKGLRSSVNGEFFTAQKEALEAAGFTVFSMELDIKDYGAPQSRERIFIVGVRNDLAYQYRFPWPTHGPGRAHAYKTQRAAIGGLPEWPEGEYETAPFHGHYLTRNRKKPWESYSYTIVAHSHHVPLHPLGEPMRKVGTDSWELCGASNRRLSWQECAILQTFDADFEPEGSLEGKYAQVGNAVPPLMGELITRPAVRFLEPLRPRLSRAALARRLWPRRFGAGRPRRLRR